MTSGEPSPGIAAGPPVIGRSFGRLLVVLTTTLAVVAGLLGGAQAPSAVAVAHYDRVASAYDAPALSSSLDTAASYVRGSPSGPGAVSWVSLVSVRDRCVAAEQRSVASLQRQVVAHTEKLGAYRASPDAFDNLGYLERAPSPEIRQRIIDGRINHLETEIRGFQDQIDKLLGGS